MTVLLDTTDVPPEQRFDFWSEAVSEALFPLQLHQMDDLPFAGVLSVYELGDVRVSRVRSAASRCIRTHAGIAAGDPERLELNVQRNGWSRATQAGRSSLLRSGDLACWDSSRPYEIFAEQPFELVGMSVPRRLLQPEVDGVIGRTATRISSDSRVGKLVAPFVARLVDRLDLGEIGEHDAQLGDRMLGLIRAVCSECRGEDLAREELSVALLPQIKDYIDARLADPRLGPDTVAHAHFISTRYLHKLFEPEGTTVSRWIWSQRLERACRDLGDPALAGESVAAIAGKWGFSAPAHFSRVFRETFGCSPREFRFGQLTEGSRQAYG